VAAETPIDWALTAALPEAASMPRTARIKGVERMNCSIEIERKVAVLRVPVTIARASQTIT
jgi:hypothetical protein